MTSRGETERTLERSDPLGSNSEIGRRLKQYYDELVTEEIPDRFASLLKQLEASEAVTTDPEGVEHGRR